jgi:hypothetical protein
MSCCRLEIQPEGVSRSFLEHRQVEETTTMLDIVTAMQLADKVIGI